MQNLGFFFVLAHCVCQTVTNVISSLIAKTCFFQSAHLVSFGALIEENRISKFHPSVSPVLLVSLGRQQAQLF